MIDAAIIGLADPTVANLQRYQLAPPAIVRAAADPWSPASASSFKQPEFSSGEANSRQNFLIAIDMGAGTSARIGPTQAVREIYQAKARASSVNRSAARANLFEVRRLTGFSWEQVAKLIGVDRRTVYNWSQGGSVRDRNASQIQSVLQILRYCDRGTAKANADLLASVRATGDSNFTLVQEGNFEVAAGKIGPGVGSQTNLPFVNTTRARDAIPPMPVQTVAGEQLFEDTYVPPPKARRRTIRR